MSMWFQSLSPGILKISLVLYPEVIPQCKFSLGEKGVKQGPKPMPITVKLVVLEYL